MNYQLQSRLQKVIQAFRENEFDLATKKMTEILRGDSSGAEVIFDVGIAYAEANRFSEALTIFDCLKLHQNSDARIPFNIGLIYSLKGEHKLALEAYDLALQIQPDNVEALINKAAICNEIKEFSDALTALDNAIKINKNYHEAYLNKGNTLRALRRYDDSISCYDIALRLNPDNHETWANKAATLYELKRYGDAVAHCDKALELKPDYSEAEWNKSLSLLVQGNFKEGLPLYESRWNANRVRGVEITRFDDKPIWLGRESLEGKTILLYGEQGLGDFIQFCRYAKLVKDLGATVILETPEALKNLMVSLDGISQLVTKGEKVCSYDFRCPLLTLPLAFKTDLNNIPFPNGYIALDSKSAKVLEWKRILGQKTRLRVGLVWTGSKNHQNDINRSLPLEKLFSQLPKEFDYVSLQNEIREEDKRVLELSGIKNFASRLNDFSDTAALIECMDLVISVDTSVAHLGGSLGKKTWVLLPYSPDWRWLLNRSDSPWYSSIKLYRQSISRDWGEVLDDIRHDLISLNQSSY